MAKMGYKPGMSLGKSQSDSAIKEPIGIDLKVGRTGIGHETHKKEKAIESLEAHRRQMVMRQKMQVRS